MQLIKQQKFEHIIRKEFNFNFQTDKEGLYLIEITASCQSWWQNFKKFKSFFKDDDLTVKINNIEFPKLSGRRGLFDGEVAWNGNNLKGHNKTNGFLVNLEKGRHNIHFLIDQKPWLQSIRIYELQNLTTVTYVPEDNNPPEDGNRRQWLNVILVDLPVQNLSIAAKTERRKRDDDDIKLIIDGEIQKNDMSNHKYWYWCGRILKGKEKIFNKQIDLKTGLHYIELWADRTPVLNGIKIHLKEKGDSAILRGSIALHKDIENIDYVRLRAAPGESGETIAELKHGNEIEVLDTEIFSHNDKDKYVPNESTVWHKIKWRDKTGYTLSTFIEIEGQERDVIIRKIKSQANKFNLDPDLMVAIAGWESRFKPYAVSYRGVKGLFQLTDAALEHLEKITGYKVTDKFDPEQNIEAGMRYYKYVILPHFNIQDTQYLKKTIAAYNAGYNVIPHNKDERLIYQDLSLEEHRKTEVEQFTKAVLKNYKTFPIRKLIIPIIAFLILSPISYFGLSQHFHQNEPLASQALNQAEAIEQTEGIISIYDYENDNDGSPDRIFRLNLNNGDEMDILKIKEFKEPIGAPEIKIWFNGKELKWGSRQDYLKRNGLDGEFYGYIKEILLWKPYNILVVQLWEGQSVYNYFFSLEDNAQIIPFAGDGKEYDRVGSAGGSGFMTLLYGKEVFFIYYMDYDPAVCEGAGNIFTLYRVEEGYKMIQIWEMKEADDWCDNFRG